MLFKLADDARRAEMMRQARQNQLARSVELSREYKRRFPQFTWFWRKKKRGEAAPQVIPEEVPVATTP
jgi:LmbE family N-acetylglucosaminyl deacetylase